MAFWAPFLQSFDSRKSSEWNDFYVHSIAIFSSQGILLAVESFDFFGRQCCLDPMAPKVKAMPTRPANPGAATVAGGSQSSGKASVQGGMVADNPDPKKELWTKESYSKSSRPVWAAMRPVPGERFTLYDATVEYIDGMIMAWYNLQNKPSEEV